ncbi:MAG TPA: hypothetical protein VFB99_08520 [Vicinamibacterales bacterium]|nr:hypothetical protein [Vicinamibacterales bacterium]
MIAPPPLPLTAPYRWAVLGRRLHRIARLSVSSDQFIEWPTAHGHTVCKRDGMLSTPGVVDRMVLERCAQCCDAVGVPRGCGAPFNALRGEAREMKPRIVTEVPKPLRRLTPEVR